MTLRIILLSLVLVGAFAWWLTPNADAAASSEAESLAAGRPLTVEITPAVKQTSYERQRRYTGAFVAARESRLAFERPGRVVRLLVDEGESVTADQPLAELDRRHLMAERRRVNARLAEAEAVLGELVAGPRKQTIASAEALVRSLSAQRDSAQQNLERRRRLVDSRSISQEEFDDFLYQYRSLQAQVDAAQRELDELLAGTRKEQVSAQRARVEQLRAELTDIDHDIEDTTLRAPYAGVVAERLLDEGSIVATGEAAFKVLDQRTPELWVGLPAKVASRLKVGDTMTAEINDAAATVTVRSLRPELAPTTRTRNAVFTVTSEDPQAVPGQIGRIAAVETVHETGYWAPTDSLTPRKRGLWAVYVAEGAGAVRTVAVRDVEVLHNEGDRSFVRGALQPGDAIIATGAHRVVEGQQVRVDTNRGR